MSYIYVPNSYAARKFFIVFSQDILQALDVLRLSVHHLVSLYCTAFSPGYSPRWIKESGEYEDISTQKCHTLRVKVAALYRISLQELSK